jgi:diaminobutyrate-2-oxoglutarate transaminase
VLISPELDVWQPGEHSGTFRGNQLAFVAGASALSFWQDSAFLTGLSDLSYRLQTFGQSLTAADSRLAVRGVGMLLGIDMTRAGGASRAAEAQRECFRRGLIVEVAGRVDEVVKVMPPLNVDAGAFEDGLNILREVLL